LLSSLTVAGFRRGEEKRSEEKRREVKRKEKDANARKTKTREEDQRLPYSKYRQCHWELASGSGQSDQRPFQEKERNPGFWLSS